MKKKTEKREISFWNKLPAWLKGVLLLLFIVLVPLFINESLILCNELFQNNGWNINAVGLGNPEWFAFWGTYFGGVATVIAVWWTVSKTEHHFKQTSAEQKRQNEAIKQDKERQRKLDILPLILLQPRITLHSNSLAVLLSGLSDKNNDDNLINIDQLKPVYEEFDMSEITILLAPELEIRVGGLSENEMKRVKNNGWEDIPNGDVIYLVQAKNITFLRPFFLINAGKEAAINIKISLVTLDDQKNTYLHHIFSLMSKEKIKLNCLVDIKKEDALLINGSYKIVVSYSDIYLNKYYQEFPLEIHDISGEKPEWKLGLNINQINEIENN